MLPGGERLRAMPKRRGDGGDFIFDGVDDVSLSNDGGDGMVLVPVTGRSRSRTGSESGDSKGDMVPDTYAGGYGPSSRLQKRLSTLVSPAGPTAPGARSVSINVDQDFAGAGPPPLADVIATAELYRHMNCPRVRVNRNMGQDDDGDKVTQTVAYKKVPINVSVHAFGAYGLGMLLYFKTLRRMAVLFFLLSALAMPGLAIIFSGGDHSSTTRSDGYPWEKFALGNFRDGIPPPANLTAWTIAVEKNKTDAAVAEAMVNGASEAEARANLTGSVCFIGVNCTAPPTRPIWIFGSPQKRSDVSLWLSLIDMVVVLVFSSALYLINGKQKLDVLMYARGKSTNISLFTIKVESFSGAFAGSNSDRVELAEHFEDLFGEVVDVSLHFNDSHLVDLHVVRARLRRLQQQADRYGRSRARLDAAMAKLERKINAARIARGEPQVEAAYVTFENSIDAFQARAAYTPKRRFFFFEERLPQSLCFQGRPIVVRDAPEPSNLIFQNIGIRPWELRVRWLLSLVMTLCTLAVSTGLVYLAQTYQRDLPVYSECPDELTPSEAAGDAQLEGCYCKARGFTSVLFNSNDSTVDGSIDCSDWLSEYVRVRLLSMVVVVSIVFVNLVLRQVVKRVGRFEKHTSLSEEQRSQGVKMFIGLFLNTGVVLLAVNAKDATYAVFDGRFSDFSEEWYNVVGVSIVLTMMFGLLSPQIVGILRLPCHACARRWARRQRTPPWTQARANQAYSGAEWDLWGRYAQLMMTVYVTLMYGAGMPILFVIAAFTFLITYWLDRISFLRLYSIPRRYDHTLAQFAFHVLPWAVLLHSSFALWIYTSPVFDGEYAGVSIGESLLGNIKDRFRTRNVPLPAVAQFLAACVYLPVAWLFGWHRVDPGLQSVARAVHFSQAHKSHKLESYRRSEQPKFRDAFMRTPSFSQLPVEMPLTQSAEQAEARKHRESCFSPGSASKPTRRLGKLAEWTRPKRGAAREQERQRESVSSRRAPSTSRSGDRRSGSKSSGGNRSSDGKHTRNREQGRERDRDRRGSADRGDRDRGRDRDRDRRGSAGRDDRDRGRDRDAGRDGGRDGGRDARRDRDRTRRATAVDFGTGRGNGTDKGTRRNQVAPSPAEEYSDPDRDRERRTRRGSAPVGAGISISAPLKVKPGAEKKPAADERSDRPGFERAATSPTSRKDQERSTLEEELLAECGLADLPALPDGGDDPAKRVRENHDRLEAELLAEAGVTGDGDRGADHRDADVGQRDTSQPLLRPDRKRKPKQGRYRRVLDETKISGEPEADGKSNRTGGPHSMARQGSVPQMLARVGSFVGTLLDGDHDADGARAIDSGRQTVSQVPRAILRRLRDAEDDGGGDRRRRRRRKKSLFGGGDEADDLLEAMLSEQLQADGGGDGADEDAVSKCVRCGEMLAIPLAQVDSGNVFACPHCDTEFAA